MSTTGITDSSLYKSIPIMAVASLAVYTKVSALALPIILAPSLLTIMTTEFLLNRMANFQITQEKVLLVLSVLTLLSLATCITSFVLLPLPIAAISIITSIYITTNACVRINDELEAGGHYVIRFKNRVAMEERMLKEEISDFIINADEEMRKNNEEILKKMVAFSEEKGIHGAASYEMLDARRREIMKWYAEIAKLSHSA